MHKSKSGTLPADMVENSPKGAIETFVANENAFSFMSSAKWKQFLYDVLVMVKQLEIRKYFWHCRAFT